MRIWVRKGVRELRFFGELLSGHFCGWCRGCDRNGWITNERWACTCLSRQLFHLVLQETAVHLHPHPATKSLPPVSKKFTDIKTASPPYLAITTITITITTTITITITTITITITMSTTTTSQTSQFDSWQLSHVVHNYDGIEPSPKYTAAEVPPLTHSLTHSLTH